MFSSVLFPDPEGPVTAIHSPRSTLKEVWLSAYTAVPYFFVNPRTSMNGKLPGSFPPKRCDTGFRLFSRKYCSVSACAGAAQRACSLLRSDQPTLASAQGGTF